MHAEVKMGRLFGSFAFLVAAACMAVALGVSFTSGNGVSVIGWMLAAMAWFILGASIIATGTDRATIDGLRQKVDALTEDRNDH